MENGFLQEHDLITRVAWKYYKEELTQQEIADSLNISRFKVMDILDKAKKEGIIEVRINSPIFNCLSLEKKMKNKYNLSDIFIIPTPKDESNIIKMIGKAGGSYLGNIIKSGDKIGTAWGRTLDKVAKSFSPDQDNNYKNVEFIWLRGGLSAESTISLNYYDAARTMADKVRADCYYIFAPARVETKKTKETFLGDEKVKTALEKARSVNLALVGIGEVTKGASLVQTGLISEKEISSLANRGAVGDILGRYFDINGDVIETEINDLMIGLNLEELKSIDKVIGFAGGKNKVESLYGALQGQYIDVLITDETTAKKLINKKA